MPHRYLIIGANGMLARAWAELLASRGIAFERAGRPGLDLAKPQTIAPAIQAAAGMGCTVVINTSAWTDVDGAEADETGATVVNGTSVGVLAQECARAGQMLVHYSTDYVFNGSALSPYSIGQRRDPISAYGRSKAVGEQLLESVGQTNASFRWLCLRTSWLYAPWGKNFLRTIAAAALSRPRLKVVNDQRGRPTSAEHLARASLALIEHGATGLLHATDGPSGEDGCTWHDFACRIVATLRECTPSGTAIAEVDACTTAEFPRPAKRPEYSVLDIAQAERVIGPMPDWRGLVADAVKRRE